MRKALCLTLALVLLCSHDLFLKMETYFLQPNQEATLSLYNGTFEESENIITRDRMLDASIVANGERTAIDPEQWQDRDSTITHVSFTPEKEGTYVTGVSTKARNIELTAEKFNSYLEHDGILDMLAKRKANGVLEDDAVESYQKHVKAIYQVGDTKTADWNTVLGYPIEFVPQANPYEKYSGQTLDVQLLLDGKPLTDQLVYADFASKAHVHDHADSDHGHSHSETASTSSHSHDDETHSHTSDGEAHSHAEDAAPENSHSHTGGQQLKTDANGMVTVDLPEDGIYYVRTIRMVTTPTSDETTHQSKWATLTFEVTHQHDATTHTHDHEHEGSIPTWIFALGSLLLVFILFFIFRKKS